MKFTSEVYNNNIQKQTGIFSESCRAVSQRNQVRKVILLSLDRVIVCSIAKEPSEKCEFHEV